MIEKLDFKNAKTISDDFEVIENKIDEIIDVVNNITTKINELESDRTNLCSKRFKLEMDELRLAEVFDTGAIRATISDLVATPAKVDELKTGAINVEKYSSFSTPTN